MPADLAAKVGYPLDTQDHTKTERVFGSVHLTTTDLNLALGLDWPVGPSTYPANAHEGTHFSEPRGALAIPVLPGQGHLGDAAYDVGAHDRWMGARGGIAVFASNPGNEDLAPAARVARGDDPNGTPDAPCGRPCRSNGSYYQANSRPYVCGRPCPPAAPQRFPPASGVWGSRHRMTFQDHPRLI